MLQPVESQSPDAVPVQPSLVRWHSPAAALISALIPGLGQLISGMRGKSTLLFTLDCIWILLFFPPLRLPDLYCGWLSLLGLGILISAAACCDALRSESRVKHPGSYLWLIGVLPVAFIFPIAIQAYLLPISGFRDFKVSSSSMAPAVQKGDLIMADMHLRHPRDGDIILLKSPNDPKEILIKRVIAKGGETIASKDGTIWRNGSPIEEPYARHTGSAPNELMNFGPSEVPANKIFVMGDNRDISLDSRMPEFGPIDESAVLGKAVYIITAVNRRDGVRLY